VCRRIVYSVVFTFSIYPSRYHANSWLVKITSNGRYLLAPTIYGQIFVFNIKSGQVTAIIKEHQDMEVRDVIFHPYRPLIFSCGDGNVQYSART